MPTIIHIDNNAINLEQLTYCSFENNMATFHFTNSKSLSVRCSEKEFEDVLDNSIKTVVPVKKHICSASGFRDRKENYSSCFLRSRYTF